LSLCWRSLDHWRLGPFQSPFWAIRGIEYFFRGQGVARVGALIGMACDESVLSLRHVTRTFVPCTILRKVNRNHVSIEGSHTQRLHFARDESGSVSPPFGLLVGWWWTHTPCDSSAAARFSVVPGLTRCERVYTCVPWTRRPNRRAALAPLLHACPVVRRAERQHAIPRSCREPACRTAS
jgi:hypothetical protein